MNTHEAIKILKNKGWKIVKLDSGNLNVLHPRWSDYDEYTPREFIELARCYTHENKRATNINQSTKKEHNGKNRSATRNAINSDDFDKIPLNRPTKSGDRWNWD